MLGKFIILLLLGLTTLLGACQNKEPIHNDIPVVTAPPPSPPPIAHPIRSLEPNQIYYTQFSFFQERNKFRTTNFRRGNLIPINTAFTLLYIKADKAHIKLMGTGAHLTINNVRRHTKSNVHATLERLGGLDRVDLTSFTPSEQAGILEGKVKTGMTKKAVLAAIGYPPQHVTPSLDANEWTYWINRLDRFIVKFNKDKVSSIVEY